MESESNAGIRIVQYDPLPIELCKLLKAENMAQSGGEAKFLISEGKVLLNGEVETRKRKKIASGDVVTFNGETIKLA
ncbi:RNA-binding S4 domain-containing protein [Puniceicoccaceae bacterium K14]|nr:RNA-binding S4 domain-containing protein [Puniceicoccaceae bacterium K14]